MIAHTGCLLESSARPRYSKSPHVGPDLRSTFSGTTRSIAAGMSSDTSDVTASISSIATSNISSSWTWSIMREFSPSSSMRRSMLTIASLITSAAVPCTGIFTAIRSAACLMW